MRFIAISAGDVDGLAAHVNTWLIKSGVSKISNLIVQETLDGLSAFILYDEGQLLVEDVEKQCGPLDRPCPDCGSPMIIRKRKKDGKPFWGCSAFPRCKKIINCEAGDPRVNGFMDAPEKQPVAVCPALQVDDDDSIPF